jgi:hypothetical protein
MANDSHAQYGTQVFDYTHLTTRSAAVMAGSAVERYDREYEFTSHFTYATIGAYQTGRAAIQTALETPGSDFSYQDPSDNAIEELAAADCIGDGPIPQYEIMNEHGLTFDVHVVIRGGVEPQGGGGTPTDTYEDRYRAGQNGRWTWTRTGTLRSSTAFDDQDDAEDTADPSPSASSWEFVQKEIKLDEDKKGVNYIFEYVEPFERLPGNLKSWDYQISESKNGLRNDITITGTGGVGYDGKKVDGLPATVIKEAKTKLPKGAKVSNISTRLDKRNGTCSFTLTAVKAEGGDLVEFEMVSTTRKDEDYRIIKRLGGGGHWTQKMGDDDIVQIKRGYKIGLKGYPSVSEFGQHIQTDKHSPFEGPDGKMLYRIDFYGEKRGAKGPAGGGGGGGGGGGAGGGSNSATGGGGGSTSGGTITVGPISGFSTFGLSGATFQGGTPSGGSTHYVGIS